MKKDIFLKTYSTTTKNNKVRYYGYQKCPVVDKDTGDTVWADPFEGNNTSFNVVFTGKASEKIYQYFLKENTSMFPAILHLDMWFARLNQTKTGETIKDKNGNATWVVFVSDFTLVEKLTATEKVDPFK